jgi:hypothetical protein
MMRLSVTAFLFFSVVTLMFFIFDHYDNNGNLGFLLTFVRESLPVLTFCNLEGKALHHKKGV